MPSTNQTTEEILIATITEEFNPRHACVAWLAMEIDTLILTLEFLLSERKIKRHRLGGTLAFCQQTPRMQSRAAVLEEFLGKLDAAEKAGGAS